MTAKHLKDSDCTAGDDGICVGCGVDHGEVCSECGARGFHNFACSTGDGFPDEAFARAGGNFQ